MYYKIRNDVLFRKYQGHGYITDNSEYGYRLFSLQKNGETAIIIEHNVEFIKTVADHIIDFGISGGESGGKIVAQGFPEAVFANKVSSLYRLDKLTY